MNLKNLGLFLIVVSLLPWVAIVVLVPFLPLDLSQKAVLVPILAIIAEVLFWLGLVLAGKEVASDILLHQPGYRYGVGFATNPAIAEEALRFKNRMPLGSISYIYSCIMIAV